jgi:acid phosphatase
MLSLTAAAGTIGLAMVSLALAQTTTVPNTATDTAAIAQQLATVMPVVPVTNKPGKVFNRFVNIMMENIDFDTAAADREYLFLLAR